MNNRQGKIKRLNKEQLSFETKLKQGKFDKCTTKRDSNGGWYVKVHWDKRKLNRLVRNFVKEKDIHGTMVIKLNEKE